MLTIVCIRIRSKNSMQNQNKYDIQQAKTALYFLLVSHQISLTVMPKKMLFSLLILISCNGEVAFNFNDHWISLNGGNGIRFEENGVYLFFKSGEDQPVNNDLLGIGKLKYELNHLKDDWFDLKVKEEGEDNLFMKGRVEVVSENRIRVYFFKHHDILDEADECHRSAKMNNFKGIMDSIKLIPE